MLIEIPDDTISDEVALCFHRANSDSDIGSGEIDEIKRGLRAVFGALAVPVTYANMAQLSSDWLRRKLEENDDGHIGAGQSQADAFDYWQPGE